MFILKEMWKKQRNYHHKIPYQFIYKMYFLFHIMKNVYIFFKNANKFHSKLRNAKNLIVTQLDCVSMRFYAFRCGKFTKLNSSTTDKVWFGKVFVIEKNQRIISRRTVKHRYSQVWLEFQCTLKFFINRCTKFLS